MAQPSVGPDPARREPVCAGANANTEFFTKAARISHQGASVVMMPRRRKTASSRVSGLLRTQRRCRRAFSVPPVRIWARRTAQTRSSGIFLENPAVFFYFWNETAGAETAGLSPAAAPGPVGCHSEHADTSWVCAQAVKNAQTAAFCMPNSVFCRHKIFLRSLAFVVGGRLPAAAPVAQRAGYFRVGGRPKVPLWPKTRGVAPKTNGYKTPKLAPVA